MELKFWAHCYNNKLELTMALAANGHHTWRLLRRRRDVHSTIGAATVQNFVRSGAAVQHLTDPFRDFAVGQRHDVF